MSRLINQMAKEGLKETVKISVATSGADYVGLKVDSNGPSVSFPMGYHIPENDDDLRKGIRNLLIILASYQKRELVNEDRSYSELEEVAYLFHAYSTVVYDFLKTGHYYVEKEPKYKTDTRGKVSWSQTVRKQRTLVQKNGSFVFTKLTIRSASHNENNQITQIHKYCVYEAFKNFGWLIVPFKPKEVRKPPERESIYLLTKKLTTTHNDEEQDLFRAMKRILEKDKKDEKGEENSLVSFGTRKFENIWEWMIDEAFGIGERKEVYFPRAQWLINGAGKLQDSTKLLPDSIMQCRGTKGTYNLYVLDAKYYPYGCKEEFHQNPEEASRLPTSSDINKQITYGEYVKKRVKEGKEQFGVFNAFIMPFDRMGNKFNCLEKVLNIGEAVDSWTDWESSGIKERNHTRIQGIVLDTSYLMHNYMDHSEEFKEKLAAEIEKGIEDPNRIKKLQEQKIAKQENQG